jgi:hypothetical protein
VKVALPVVRGLHGSRTAFIRFRFMSGNLWATIGQIIVGGGIVFAIEIWLGRLAQLRAPRARTFVFRAGRHLPARRPPADKVDFELEANPEG